MGWFKDFFMGKKDKFSQKEMLSPEQMAIQRQMEGAAQGAGAGGAFGDAADYYRDLLSNDPEAMKAFSAPEMRNFNENIIPQLGEQFAGMGAGGLSSSSFRNAAVNEGAGLSERLGAMRQSLRQQGAAGLQGIGQAALNPHTQNIYQPAQPGFLQNMAGGIGQGIGGMGTMGAGNWISNKWGR